jgi:hypothetical protein
MSLFRNETVYTPNIVGVQDGTSAQAGSVGEYLSSLVAVGAPVSLTTATPANVTSLSLTPGDWNLDGNINFTAAAATTADGALWVGAINTTTATVSTDGSEVQLNPGVNTTTSFKDSITIPMKRVLITTTTIVYLVVEATFTAGTVGAYGKLSARRIR